MRKFVIYTALLLLLVTAVFAQGTTWYPVSVKYTWNQDGFGFCPYESQCFVSATGDPEYDQPDGYFTGNVPKCINNTKYINDFYCDNGEWTTRTKLVAAELLSVADQADTNKYSIFCDDYNKALNRWFYLIDTVNVQNRFTGGAAGCFPYDGSVSSTCANDICVLNYKNGVAFGLSLNVPVNHDTKSFLPALNLSDDDCDNVNHGGYQECTNSPGNGRLYYNLDLNSLIYIPTGSLPTSQASSFNQVFKNNFAKISDYVNDVVYVPTSVPRNLTFFNGTGLFNNLYYAKSGNKKIFAFLETDQTWIGHDYIGVNYEGVSLGSDPCFNILKLVGQEFKGKNVYCENQTSTARFVVVAKKTPGPGGESPVVDAWKDLGGKLRP